GWWYFAERPGAGTTAVYLTDGDLLESGSRALEAHLRREFLAAGLPPDVTHCFGTPAARLVRDARASCRRVVLGGRLVAVGGDAAYTVDPLSGSGLSAAIRTAVRGAEAVARFLTRGDIKPLIQAAVQTGREFSETVSHRREVYRPAAARFPRSLFWRRRVSGL